MNVFLYLAEAFIVAYVMRTITNKLRVPSVSGYVLGGMLLGGSMFYWFPWGTTFSEKWLFTENTISHFSVITQIALSIIALSIGVELEWRNIKKLGRSIVFITLFEASLAFLLVTAVTFLIWRNLPFSLLLGAIASATAPAATVAVIQQYKAKGPLTSTILAVIGIDDAISFIIFAFAMAITKGYLRGEHINIIMVIAKPLLEIFIALLIGSVIGFLAGGILSRTRDNENAVFILSFVILLVSGLSLRADVSSLLANMACGTVIVNINPLLKNRIRSSFGPFMPIFYSLFFIIGGAHLNITSISTIWKMALVYFVCRSFGKSAGASLGAIAGKALPQVRKLVGFSLLPQVGAAVALALVIQHEFGFGAFGDIGTTLAENTINILLITTLLTESIGPYMTKNSLIKAGEVKE